MEGECVAQVCSIRKFGDVQKLKKIQVTDNDLFIIFSWGKGARKIQQELKDKGANVFPDVDFSLFLNEKNNQLKTIDKLTYFNIERIYFENDKYQTVTVPKIKNSNKVVVKIGNDHQGINKYLLNPGNIITTKENVLFEEYIDNSRSIRIAIFGDNNDSIFIIEHVNSEHAKDNPQTKWIKNIAPDEFVYSYRDRQKTGISRIDEIIEDAMQIYKHFNHPYIGIDYVVNDEKVGLLEVNDMIGLAEDERIYEVALDFFRKLTAEYI